MCNPDFSNPCLWCGKELPEGSRVSKQYCNPTCYNAMYHAEEAKERLRAKEGRICPGCGGPVSPKKREETIYCTPTCRVRTYNARYAVTRPPNRKCLTCGKEWFTNSKSRKFCCRLCYDAHLRSQSNRHKVRMQAMSQPLGDAGFSRGA